MHDGLRRRSPGADAGGLSGLQRRRRRDAIRRGEQGAAATDRIQSATPPAAMNSLPAPPRITARPSAPSAPRRTSQGCFDLLAAATNSANPPPIRPASQPVISIAGAARSGSWNRATVEEAPGPAQRIRIRATRTLEENRGRIGSNVRRALPGGTGRVEKNENDLPRRRDRHTRPRSTRSSGTRRPETDAARRCRPPRSGLRRASSTAWPSQAKGHLSMVRLPVLTELRVTDYELFPGDPPGSGIAWSFQQGVTVIAGINGLGKTTLLLMILRSLTGPYDLTEKGEWRSLRVVLPRKPVRLETPHLRVFGRRVSDRAVNARVALSANIGTNANHRQSTARQPLVGTPDDRRAAGGAVGHGRRKGGGFPVQADRTHRARQFRGCAPRPASRDAVLRESARRAVGRQRAAAPVAGVMSGAERREACSRARADSCKRRTAKHATCSFRSPRRSDN